MAHQREVRAVPQNAVSEDELEGKLHDSWARCCSRCSESSRADVLPDQARDPCNSAGGRRGGARKLRRAHSADVRAVKHVECFPDDLQAHALGELHITRHARTKGNRGRQIESIQRQSPAATKPAQ